jgi:hypothetical protein
MTYAWDKRKIFVPVLAKFKEYQAVMSNPGDYTETLRDDMDEVNGNGSSPIGCMLLVVVPSHSVLFPGGSQA